MIAQFNTCDIENYGDLLYPLVLQALLRQRKVSQPVIPTAFLAGKAPQAAGYQVRNISELLRSVAREPTTLVIGGGDILRTDSQILAAHYHGIFLQRKQQILDRSQQAWLASAQERFPNWLRRLTRSSVATAAPTIPADDHELTDEFSERFFGHSELGPFLLDRANYPDLHQLIYLSCGVPFAIDPAEASRVSAALDSATFIYLRDEPSRQKLQQAGVRSQLHVAPDIVVTLSDIFPAEELRGAGRALMQAQGVIGERPIVCFQCHPVDGPSADLIINRLLEYQRQTGAEIVLLPIGYCHDDTAILRHIAHYGYGKFHYLELPSVHSIMAVIAASDLFAGTSLHGNITAFSYGVPHLLCSGRLDKVGGFMEQVGIRDEQLLPSWSRLSDSLGQLQQLDRQLLVDRAARAKAIVQRTMDELISRGIRAEAVT